MVRKLSRRKMLGFALIEVMAVSAIMTSLNSQGGGYQYAISYANEVKGISNLRQIYQLIMMQEIGTGSLPSAAFYPKEDPKKDAKSILMLLGAPSELFVSPFAPEGLKSKGLTFAWNDTVNGKTLDSLPKDTWLLVDVAAFITDPAIPKPKRYLILYADGRALAVANLPGDIVKAVADAQAKQKAEEQAKQKAQEQK